MILQEDSSRGFLTIEKSQYEYLAAISPFDTILLFARIGSSPRTILSLRRVNGSRKSTAEEGHLIIISSTVCGMLFTYFVQILVKLHFLKTVYASRISPKRDLLLSFLRVTGFSLVEERKERIFSGSMREGKRAGKEWEMSKNTSWDSQGSRPELKPATSPEQRRAAVAQRMGEKPPQVTRGVYYSAPQRSTHAPGWRTRRYLKRKYLRRSNLQVAAMEHLSTQLTLLPMALIALVIVLLMNGTQQRYGADVVTLADILPGDSLKLYDRHSTLFYQMTNEGLQTSVPLSQISRNLINAEVAIEDQNFWKNAGFDITGIVRAAIADLAHGHVVAGGSTITQQLIKNTLVGSQDTIMRKLQEIILAPDITRHYTKQQILTMYLNTVYYGEQAYGADAAAFQYFDLKDTPTRSAASQLDLAQAAMLAGLPQSPIAHDPFRFPNSALARMREVLTQMQIQGYITLAQAESALAEASKPGFLHHGIVKNLSAPHFVNYTLRELASHLNVKIDDLARSGLIVHTTLDLPLQNKILKVAQEQIALMKAPHNLSDAAEVVIDYHTGALRVLLGNVDPGNPRDGQFDVASQGLRQPGSSFKPFIYATAFAEGLSPGMPV